MKKQSQDGGFIIPREYLLHGIGNAVADVDSMLLDFRKSLGSRYNEKNDFEVCKKRFGFNDSEKLLAEYELIWQKKSKQPSVVRRIIRQIGDHARQYAINKYLLEHATPSEDVKQAQSAWMRWKDSRWMMSPYEPRITRIARIDK